MSCVLLLHQVDYLDLVYVHWPVPTPPAAAGGGVGSPVAHVVAYRALEQLCAEGLVRAIGLSNYRIEDYEALLAAGPLRVEPAVNQIEANPFLFRRATVEYFAGRGVAMVAYKPFLRGGAFGDPTVSAVASRYGVSAGEVLLRWSLNHGFTVLPKSTNPGRMAANLACFPTKGGWDLSDEDMDALDALTVEPASGATFEQHFSKRAVADPAAPTVALGYAGHPPP